MEFVIKVDITDSLAVDALVAAKEKRKMPALVANALSHYVRTPEGKRSLALISGNAAVKAKRAAPQPPPAKQEEAERIDIGSFLKS